VNNVATLEVLPPHHRSNTYTKKAVKNDSALFTFFSIFPIDAKQRGQVLHRCTFIPIELQVRYGTYRVAVLGKFFSYVQKNFSYFLAAVRLFKKNSGLLLNFFFAERPRGK